MTDLDTVTRWIDGYLRAWNSNDPEDIGGLFTDDAAYQAAPYRAPWQGREEIVAGWREHEDEPGEISFEWRPISITDEVAVISGTTRYPESAYSNLWVIKLDQAGRCREFSEWWMEHPRST
jgi:uncharacterized protein (TIGR02246 family)